MENFDALAKSYGLVVALLVGAVFLLGKVARDLHRENAELHDRIAKILEERGKALESLLAQAVNDRRGGS